MNSIFYKEIRKNMAMVCNNCNKRYSDDSLFCPSCGNKLQDDNMWVCNKCGNINSKEGNFCIKCGNKRDTLAGESIKEINTEGIVLNKDVLLKNEPNNIGASKGEVKQHKKTVALLILVILMITGVCFFAEYQNYINEGKKAEEAKSYQTTANFELPYIMVNKNEIMANALQVPMGEYRKLGDLSFKVPSFCKIVSDSSNLIEAKDLQGIIDPVYKVSVECIDAKYDHSSFKKFTITERRNIGSDFVARYKENAANQGVIVINSTHSAYSFENCGIGVTVSCTSNFKERSFFDNQFIFLHKKKYYIVTITEPYDKDGTYNKISYYASYAVLLSLSFDEY